MVISRNAPSGVSAGDDFPVLRMAGHEKEGFGVKVNLRHKGRATTYALWDVESFYRGQLVNARPFYHVPSGSASLKSVESEYTFEARVIEPLVNMVLVEFTWGSTPGERKQVFYPRELHDVHECGCRACTGDF